MTEIGRSLGSKMSSEHHQIQFHGESQKVNRSDLERGHHKDGQMSMTHGLGGARSPWQRKKNHQR
jgi:hypothetical protein